MKFKDEVKAAIKRQIGKAKRDDITAMSRDCMWQCMRLVTTSPDSPRGTNAAYYARQAFDEVIDATPEFKAFLSL